MGSGKFTDGHGPASGEDFDIVVRARHVAVLEIGHRTTQMLDDVGRHAHRLDRRAIFVDRQILEDDLATERLGEFRRHLLMVHLDGAGEGDGLADLLFGFFSSAAMARP